MNKNKNTLKKNENIIITKKINLMLQKLIVNELSKKNTNFNYKANIINKFIKKQKNLKNYNKTKKRSA